MASRPGRARLLRLQQLQPLDFDRQAVVAWRGAVVTIRFRIEQPGTGTPGSGKFVPWTGSRAQRFNFGPLQYMQRPDTRYQGGYFAHYEENKELDIYSSFMFTDDHTVEQLAPSGLFLGSGASARRLTR